MTGSRRLLAIFPKLTEDLSKSAHLLVLKYLRACGWASTVLTIATAGSKDSVEEWNGLRIVRLRPESVRWRAAQKLAAIREADHSGPVHKAFSAALLPVAAAISFPDTYTSSAVELVARAERLHREESFDVVVSLYHPLAAHTVARRFSRSQQVPWIALTKDFYSWPDALVRGVAARWTNGAKRRLEARSLTGAKALVTISDYMTNYLRTIVPRLPIHTLPHCFDPDDYRDRESWNLPDSIFRLVTAGRSLRKHDEAGLRLLFEAVRRLAAEGIISPHSFRIQFVGSGGAFSRQMAKEAACESFVDIIAPREHGGAIEAMCSATCLLYIQTPFGTRRRLAEYLGAQRPILACPAFPGTMSDTLLNAYVAGRVAGNVDALCGALREFVGRHRADPTLSFAVEPQFIEAHSAKCRAREFSDLLLGITG